MLYRKELTTGCISGIRLWAISTTQSKTLNCGPLTEWEELHTDLPICWWITTGKGMDVLDFLAIEVEANNDSFNKVVFYCCFSI